MEFGTPGSSVRASIPIYADLLKEFPEAYYCKSRQCAQ